MFHTESVSQLTAVFSDHSLQLVGCAAVLVGVAALLFFVRRKSPSRGPPSPRPVRGPVALNPKEKIPFKLISKQNVSHDTRRFRFALQSAEHVLGLPVGIYVGK